MLNPLLGAFVAYMGRLHLQGWHVRKDVCPKEGRTQNCMWVAAVGRRAQVGDDGGGNGKGVQVDTWTPMKLETKGAGLGCVLVASVHLVASSFFGGARLVCVVRLASRALTTSGLPCSAVSISGVDPVRKAHDMFRLQLGTSLIRKSAGAGVE